MLNEQGKQKARELAEAFNDLAQKLEGMGCSGRHHALTMTKLEEACFVAKKSLASNPLNQQEG